MVTVISACRNEEKHIRAFLESLLQQETLEEGCEYILADGLSTDNTWAIIEEYARRHPAIRVIRNSGRFVSAGLNAAIREARGRIIIRMDAHTVYAPNYVRECVATLERTGADNVGGPARTRATGYLHRSIASAYHSRFGSGGASFHDTSFEGWTDTVTYGCWYRETLERLSMFDESMIRNQDDELNLRLVRAGGRIWQSPNIVSWYSPRSSLSTLWRQYSQYGFWKMAVIRKHKLPARWSHLVPGMLVLGEIGLPLIGALLFLFGQTGFAMSTLVAFLLMNVVYGSAILVASVLTAKTAGWDLLPLLPITFATYHLSYGTGFLRGAVVFGFLRTPSDSSGRMSELTR